MQNNIDDMDVFIEPCNNGILVDFKSAKARMWTIDNIVDEGAKWVDNDKLFISQEFIDHFNFFMFSEDFQMYTT